MVLSVRAAQIAVLTCALWVGLMGAASIPADGAVRWSYYYNNSTASANTWKSKTPPPPAKYSYARTKSADTTAITAWASVGYVGTSTAPGTVTMSFQSTGAAFKCKWTWAGGGVGDAPQRCSWGYWS